MPSATATATATATAVPLLSIRDLIDAHHPLKSAATIAGELSVQIRNQNDPWVPIVESVNADWSSCQLGEGDTCAAVINGYYKAYRLSGRLAFYQGALDVYAFALHVMGTSYKSTLDSILLKNNK